MSVPRTLLLTLFLAAPVSQAQQPPPVVEQASLPLPVDALVAARAFVLEEPRPYDWMKGHAPIHSGVLLAVDAEPALCLPRQVAEPVIYVGGVPAERLATDWVSGRLLLLVPGEPDLAALPLYFGVPELPERIDDSHGQAALAEAWDAGLQPFTPDRVAAASSAGGEPLQLRDSRSLELAIASFIDAWAPQERQRADGLRAPAPGAGSE